MVRLLCSPKGLIGAAIIAAIILAAIGADLVSPYDPLAQNLRARFVAPSLTNGHAFGADQLGRDILSRIIHGARVSILVGASAVLISGVLGTLIGLIAGFYGGVVGATLMRIADIKLAMPMILFAITWIAFFGAGLLSVIIIIGVWGWVPYARYSRGMVMFLREAPFVQASIAMGAGNGSLIFRHIAPNLIAPLVVLATLQLGEAVLLESALSFLGVGVQAPTPTWGTMISDGRNYVDSAWWTVTFPGLAITAFVLGSNFLGDALRDFLEPRSI